jgi:hypothetical protein
LAPDGERTAFLRAISSRKKGSSDFILKRVVWKRVEGGKEETKVELRRRWPAHGF